MLSSNIYALLLVAHIESVKNMLFESFGRSLAYKGICSLHL